MIQIQNQSITIFYDICTSMLIYIHITLLDKERHELLTLHTLNISCIQIDIGKNV